MEKEKKGTCALRLEQKEVKDISGIVIFWSKKGFPNLNGNVCEDCYKELIKYKGMWSKDGKNGMKLKSA